MANEELALKVTELRNKGLTPKAIARALGMRQTDIAELVRSHAASRTVMRANVVVGSWLSAGWGGGLSWDGHDEWQDGSDSDGGAFGLVTALVAREHRYGNVSTCGYLVDTHCLGVKNAVGPRVMDRAELSVFRQQYFSSFRAPPVAVPFDLVQNLVLGAVEFARGLGFEPHRDFAACREHLGEWAGPSPIRFGCDGRPTFVNGPHDDVPSVLRTLERSVGRGNFDFVRLD